MHRDLEATLRAVEAAAAEMGREQLLRHPDGKWCAAQVLEHLWLSYASTARELQKSLDSGTPDSRPPSLRQRVARLVVINMGQMPSGRTAPEHVTPKTGPHAETALADFRARLAAMDEMIGRCEQRFGSRAVIGRHSILGPLTADGWRRFHLVHGRHHARQIERLNSRQSNP